MLQLLSIKRPLHYSLSDVLSLLNQKWEEVET